MSLPEKKKVKDLLTTRPLPTEVDKDEKGDFTIRSNFPRACRSDDRKCLVPKNDCFKTVGVFLVFYMP